MTTPELLPCPFCGDNRASTYHVRDGRVSMCPACGAKSGSQFNGPLDLPSADDRAIAAWNRRTPSPEVAALIAEARREWCKKMDRIADEIDEQVKVTRAYVGDCSMDHNQKELMKICTSHFLDKAATIRALKEETHD